MLRLAILGSGVALVALLFDSPTRTSRAADARFASTSGFGHDEAYTIVLAGRRGRSLSARAGVPSGWSGLRHRLEACGQEPGAMLRVSVDSGRGLWPWGVSVEGASPGAEACLVQVLRTAPLDGTYDQGFQHIRTRFRLADLDVVPILPAETPEQSCTARWVVPFEGDVANMSHREVEVDPSPLDGVICGADIHLTRLTLTFGSDGLTDVATDPPVACVEALAREGLAQLPSAWSARFKEPVDTVTCTFDLPLEGL